MGRSTYWTLAYCVVHLMEPSANIIQSPKVLSESARAIRLGIEG